MYQLVAILFFVSSIVCMDIFQLILEDDYQKTFENQYCNSKSDWILTKYKDIGISAHGRGPNALQATNNGSCVSVPIFLSPGSTLELIGYVESDCLNCKIEVTVYLEDDDIISSITHTNKDEKFEGGWGKILLVIDKGGYGHINILGYSQDNKMVLIDSIQYTNRTDIIYANTDNSYINMEEVNDVLRQEELQNNSTFKANKLFGDSFGGLGLWGIILVTVGVLTILALFTVGAYHLGKLSGWSNQPSPILLDVEPPKVDMIPRVTGTSNFENTLQNYI